MNQSPLAGRLAALLRAGSRAASPARVGLTLERFLLDADGRPVPFFRAEGVLRRIRPFYTGETRTDGWLTGLSRPDCLVRLVRAGQLSCRIAPQQSLMRLRRLHERVAFELDAALAAEGLTVCERGVLPAEPPLDLPLLPDPRTSCLGAFLSASGADGGRLLKDTAHLTVTLDYADERDFSRKLAAACRLTPLLMLYAEHTPSGGGHLLRAALCAQSVPELFGFPDCAFEGASFADYAAWVCRMPPVLLPDGEGFAYTGSVPASALFRRRPATDADAAFLLDAVYPWVRAAGGLQLRMADSMPLPQAISFAALCRGLLCDARNLARVEDAFGALGQRETEDILRRMRTDGENVPVAGRPAAEWLVILRLWAREALGTLERGMVMSPYELFSCFS